MTKREKAFSESCDEGLGTYDYTGWIRKKFYGRLLDIAEENGLVTFDINDAINFVIANFPTKFDKN